MVTIGDVYATEIQMSNKTQVFLLRMRPETRALLDKAAQDQGRSRASIIDQLIKEGLEPRYGDLHERLLRVIGGAVQ